MNIIKKIFADLRLSEAIRLAEKAHAENGNRYYVIPNGRTEKLVVTDRSNYRKLRHKGYYVHNAKMNDVNKASFYYTPNKIGDGELSEECKKAKRLQYYHWVESLRKNK